MPQVDFHAQKYRGWPINHTAPTAQTSRSAQLRAQVEAANTVKELQQLHAEATSWAAMAGSRNPTAAGEAIIVVDLAVRKIAAMAKAARG